MRFVEVETESTASRWTSRIALFSLGVLLTALVLHRLFGMPTAVAFNLVGAAYVGVALSLLTALAATISIWRTGARGAARVVFALVISVLMLALPLLVLALAAETPPINDVTTDMSSPPRFEATAKLRGPGSNAVDYPGQKFAVEQARAYPDLKTMVVNRSAEEAFELAVDAVKKLRMSIVREDVPGGESGAAGTIEAYDRTLVLGFYDDLAVRVVGSDETARIDIRSASRFGRIDFGTNAERVRALMREIVVRLDATVGAAGDERGAAGKKDGSGKVKRGKEDDPTEGRRKSRDRGR